MASNYDEKILATFGKRDKRSIDPSQPDESVNGVFVVDPNKVIDSEDNIKPRYIKQEDLVMYANITARLNPDSTIIEGTDNNDTNFITIGRVGVNALNPLKTTTKDSNGNTNFNGYKNSFTTDWSDYFTSNESEGSFFDPETFGISNIDVTHNASLVPIIKVDFIDVQGRTLLERGDDETNPYNIFYRFPYPLFTLTIKGYYGKAIEYPLSMIKTSTTFDSTTGNYIIKAEFLSRTFSIYNNFLMAYAAVAPYMYKVEGTNDFLGKRLLKGLYQKQNLKYKELYGENSNEYKKLEFTKYPSIQDLSRAENVLGYDNLSVTQELEVIKNKKSDAYKALTDINNGFSFTDDEIYEEIKGYYNQRNDEWYLNDKAINDKYIPSSNDGIYLEKTLSKYIGALEKGNNLLLEELKTDIKNKISEPVYGLPNTYLGYINNLNSDYNLSELISDDLLIINKTTKTDKESLSKVYVTYKHVRTLNDIITRSISEFYEKQSNNVTDNFTYDLKKKIGYVPNMGNVVRILMNNMQVFLSMLNLVGLNAANQLNNDYDRQGNQKSFGETINDNYYPFPNYYEKKYDENIDDTTIQKTYPGNEYTKDWFEVQFVEEIFRALKELDYIPDKTIDSDSETTYEYKNTSKPVNNITSDRKFGLLSTLLVENNLDYYNIEQTSFESFEEFISKILSFSTLGFLNINGDKSKIGEITKLMVDHEYDLIQRRLSGLSENDRLEYTNNMMYYYDLSGTPNYEAICSNRVTLGAYNNNYEAVISQVRPQIFKMRELINSDYSIAEFNKVYEDIENLIDKAVDINQFKSIYDYEPLRYKNKRNQNGLIGIKSLFFKGLDYHDEYEGYSVSLNKFSDELNNYRAEGGDTIDVPTLGMYSYYITDSTRDVIFDDKNVGKHKPKYLDKRVNYKIDNKVSSNNRYSNALALSNKTDNLFGMDPDKKESSNIKYSKINL